MEPAATPSTPIIPDEIVKEMRRKQKLKRIFIISGVLGFIAILTVVVISNLPTNNPLLVAPIPTPTLPAVKPTATATWPSYTANPLALSLNLPPKLATVQSLTLTESQSQTGKQLCWTSWLLEAFNSDTFGECSRMPFSIHTSTEDFQSRQHSVFYANRGYETNADGTIHIIRSDTAKLEVDPDLINPYINTHDVKMIIIEGKSTPTGEPLSGTPGAGKVGAIINLPQGPYPAVTLTYALNATQDLITFYAILDSITAGNPTINPTPLPSLENGSPAPTRATANPTSKLRSGCVVAGCSSQLCVESSQSDITTTCEFKWEYQCYRSATCEVQTDGQCGWTMTPELQACLGEM
jgi:hypothetical protein